MRNVVLLKEADVVTYSEDESNRRWKTPPEMSNTLMNIADVRQQTREGSPRDATHYDYEGVNH